MFIRASLRQRATHKPFPQSPLLKDKTKTLNMWSQSVVSICGLNMWSQSVVSICGLNMWSQYEVLGPDSSTTTLQPLLLLSIFMALFTLSLSLHLHLFVRSLSSSLCSFSLSPCSFSLPHNADQTQSDGETLFPLFCFLL